jgi:hypothetical protein
VSSLVQNDPFWLLDGVMMDCPRLLEDRDVVVIRGGQPEQTRLRGRLDGHDGPMPCYRIELVTRAGNYTCPYTATAPDMFGALVRCRRQLEPDGCLSQSREAGATPAPAGWHGTRAAD